MKLDEFLEKQQVPFERLPHAPAYSANRIAKILHVPGREVAKTVLVRADSHYAVVVLPATHQVDLQRVRKELGAEQVELASEAEIEKIFPDCESGAIPPFGSLYHLTTLVDESLSEDKEIVFDGQTHSEAIRMNYQDFAAQENPRLGHFASSHFLEMVDQFSKTLVKKVRKQLPPRLRQRIDPEDVVQSVFRSFFRRLKDGKYTFEDSEHVWRLLTMLTYHRVRTLVKYHQQSRRDVRREERHGAPKVARADPEPGPEDVASLDELLNHFLQELPENHRRIVSLRADGASVGEISKKTRFSERTIRRVLAQVQEAIQREMHATK